MYLVPKNSKASKTNSASKASKAKHPKAPTTSNMDSWTCDQLKDYLREQKGRHSNMNKDELLELAKLYSQKPKEDPKIAAAYEIHYAEILQKRKLFKVSDQITREDIFSFDIVLSNKFVFDKIVVNRFLSCCPIEIENEVVDTGIKQPADKAKCSKCLKLFF